MGESDEFFVYIRTFSSSLDIHSERLDRINI